MATTRKTTEATQNPTHTYPSNPATYTVTLTVSNTAGRNSASEEVKVPSAGDPPDNGDGPPRRNRTQR